MTRTGGGRSAAPISANGQVRLALPLQFRRDAVIHAMDLALGWIYEQPTGIQVSLAADAAGVPVVARQTCWLVLTAPSDKPGVYAGWNNHMVDPGRNFGLRLVPGRCQPGTGLCHLRQVVRRAGIGKHLQPSAGVGSGAFPGPAGAIRS